jgi:hypothetical protein
MRLQKILFLFMTPPYGRATASFDEADKFNKLRVRGSDIVFVEFQRL